MIGKQWYVVQLRNPVQWLGHNRKWLDEEEHAERFATFLEANQASEGHDVVVRALEDRRAASRPEPADRAYDAVLRRWERR